MNCNRFYFILAILHFISKLLLLFCSIESFYPTRLYIWWYLAIWRGRMNYAKIVLFRRDSIALTDQMCSRWYLFLLYWYWWNTRIFPFTKKSYLHRAQWRYHFYLSRVRILVSPWLRTWLANSVIEFFSSLLEFWLFGTENISIIVFISPL